MGKTVACIIARTGSSRLPGKVLQNVTSDHSMIGFIVERIKKSQTVDEIFICTTREKEDDELESVARGYNVNIYRGSTEEVIERFISVGELTKAERLIRITGDNVFTAYEYLDLQVQFMEDRGLDYVRLIDAPLGATAEVMSFKALMDCYENIDPVVSEYLLMFMFNPQKYRCGVIKPLKSDSSGITITVDTLEDLERTRMILDHYKGDPLDIKLSEIIEIVNHNKIPHSLFSPDQKVKMPYGKLISYKEFKEDMAERESRSVNMAL